MDNPQVLNYVNDSNVQISFLMVLFSLLLVLFNLLLSILSTNKSTSRLSKFVNAHKKIFSAIGITLEWGLYTYSLSSIIFYIGSGSFLYKSVYSPIPSLASSIVSLVDKKEYMNSYFARGLRVFVAVFVIGLCVVLSGYQIFGPEREVPWGIILNITFNGLYPYGGDVYVDNIQKDVLYSGIYDYETYSCKGGGMDAAPTTCTETVYLLVSSLVDCQSYGNMISCGLDGNFIDQLINYGAYLMWFCCIAGFYIFSLLVLFRLYSDKKEDINEFSGFNICEYIVSAIILSTALLLCLIRECSGLESSVSLIWCTDTTLSSCNVLYFEYIKPYSFRNCSLAWLFSERNNIIELADRIFDR